MIEPHFGHEHSKKYETGDVSPRLTVITLEQLQSMRSSQKPNLEPIASCVLVKRVRIYGLPGAGSRLTYHQEPLSSFGSLQIC